MEETDQSVDKELDLPLMANVEDYRIRHYMMKLSFNFNPCFVQGESIIFFENISGVSQDFIIDQRHLHITSVKKVDICHLEVQKIQDFKHRKDFNFIQKMYQVPVIGLEFTQEDWSLRIPMDTFDIKTTMIIRISWTTPKTAKSLMWRKTQEGQECVFTAAAAVNNRSLFPCQEPPIAMATWQCLIKSSDPKHTILCTGDENPQVLSDGNHYFYTQMILPMSTFAVAISAWEVSDIVGQESLRKVDALQHCQKLHEFYPCHLQRGDIGPLLPCRLIGPKALIDKALKSWSLYLPACLKSAYDLLGPHPFRKLDIVIVPRCYSGLGLASPSLMFVSQSVISDDGGMLIRLSHEIAHNWFGLLIGAMDWTEEWLTEVIILSAYN